MLNLNNGQLQLSYFWLEQWVYFRCNLIWPISFRLWIGQEREQACFAQIKVQVSDSEQRSHVSNSDPPAGLLANLNPWPAASQTIRLSLHPIELGENVGWQAVTRDR